MKFGTALLLAAAATGSVSARIVDYSMLNADNFVAEAARLKVAPVTQPPSRSGRDITIETAAGVDHEVLTLGNYCSAYKVQNPMASMLRALFAEAGRNAAVQATDAPLRISVATARSNQRCVEIAEYNFRCIARVTLIGTGEVGVRKFPLNVSIERNSSVGGFCEDRARGMAVISREAGQLFLAAALVAAYEPRSPPP